MSSYVRVNDNKWNNFQKFSSFFHKTNNKQWFHHVYKIVLIQVLAKTIRNNKYPKWEKNKHSLILFRKSVNARAFFFDKLLWQQRLTVYYRSYLTYFKLKQKRTVIVYFDYLRHRCRCENIYCATHFLCFRKNE